MGRVLCALIITLEVSSYGFLEQPIFSVPILCQSNNWVQHCTHINEKKKKKKKRKQKRRIWINYPMESTKFCRNWWVNEKLTILRENKIKRKKKKIGRKWDKFVWILMNKTHSNFHSQIIQFRVSLSSECLLLILRIWLVVAIFISHLLCNSIFVISIQ